jgi:DNA-binding transcriptional MerR regulator
MVDHLADKLGLTARQIRYWRKKGYVVAARKEGRAWVYDMVSVKRLALIASLLKEGATPQAVLASVRALEMNAQQWLKTDLWRLKVYVLGSEVLASNGEILVNPATGNLAMPILLERVVTKARSAAVESGQSSENGPERTPSRASAGRRRRRS